MNVGKTFGGDDDDVIRRPRRRRRRRPRLCYMQELHLQLDLHGLFLV